MQQLDDAPLAPWTTLRLGGPARHLRTVHTDADAISAIRDADRRGEPLLVLGGGSNLVISDEGFDGTALRLATEGMRREGDTVTVAAGQRWSDVVEHTVAAGLAGIECLAGVPGSTGATPIQNVGAYGQEVSSTVTEVWAYDRQLGETVTLNNAQCRFGYRNSLFKELAAAGEQRYVVLRVSFALRDTGGRSAPLAYPEVARNMGVEQGERVPLRQAADTVLRLRRGKGMVLDPDDHDTWSAGSFFTNPVLSQAEFDAFARRARQRLGAVTTPPAFPAADGGTKTSAAWLIERAGFAKGHGSGPATLSTKHNLALTNRGAASTQDLLALAREVRDGVSEAFGVRLVNEPVLVGVKL